MKLSTLVVPLLLGLFASLGSGCVSQEYTEIDQPSRRAPATLLTLVDESHQLTPEQLVERRRNIVTYLITEGYIYSGEDLVQSASSADQIIRATLAPDGSFELTIYRPDRASHREVAFDLDGNPEYSCLPGDIGYFGDGINPYLIPVAVYFDERDYRDRFHPHHDRDSRYPARPVPPGQRPDWNHEHPWARHRDTDDHRHRPQGPPPTRQLGGNHNEHRPTKDQAQPAGVKPLPPTAQPETHRSGPDHQPLNSHPVPPSASKPMPRAGAPATVQGQIEPHRSRAEPQSQQQPANASRSVPASPPSQGRSQSGAPTPRPTPPATQTPSPVRSAPEPAKDQSSKSDSNQNNTNSNDRRR